MVHLSSGHIMFWVNIIHISLAATPVTVIPVATSTRTSVQSTSHRVLVTLISIILRTPYIIAKVSVTIVIPVTRIVTRHVYEVGSSVAVTPNIAHIYGVGEHLVH